MADDKTILFIPGWLDSGAVRGYENSWDIWQEPLDMERLVATDYIVAHSAGALLALAAWEKNKNISLILVSPLLDKKNLFVRWTKVMLLGGGVDLTWKRFKVLSHLFPGLIKLKRLLKIDPQKIIREMPKDKILIIRGRKDKYICTEDSLRTLKIASEKIIQLDGVGHNWCKKIDETINDYISGQQ